MITEVNAAVFRQNFGEMLNQVQDRKNRIVLEKDGKAVAALVDAELFARIRRRLRNHFDALTGQVAMAYADVPEEQGMPEIDGALERRLRKF